MSHCHELPAELTIYSAAETRAALLGWLGAQGAEPVQPLALSGQRVSEVDGAGLQLLCALSLSLEQQGWEWRLVSPSAALQAGCRALGLAEWLASHVDAEVVA